MSLSKAVSTASRDLRVGEIDGWDYKFISSEKILELKALIKNTRVYSVYLKNGREGLHILIKFTTNFYLKQVFLDI